MLPIIASVFLAGCALISHTSAQCLNNVAAFNPSLRTMSSNNTWLVVPISKDAVQKAIDELYPQQVIPSNKLTLLDVPNDPTLFPSGFPPNTHPVFVSSGYNADIRLTVLQIDGALQQSSVYVPYVGKGGSATPLNVPLNSYIAGTDDATIRQLAGLGPAVVSTLLGGIPLRLGSFEPGNAAYQSDGAGQFAVNSKWNVVPNPITGPGVFIEAQDLAFVTTTTPKYTLTGLKRIINQPVLLSGPGALFGQCIRNTYYFGNATARPLFQSGNATLGPGASGYNALPGQTSVLQRASPDGVGNFLGVDGVSACAQNVGNNPEDCEQAARTVDPAAL